MFSLRTQPFCRQVRHARSSVLCLTTVRAGGRHTASITRQSFHCQTACLAAHDPRSKQLSNASPKGLSNLKLPETVRENIYTLPNLLTVSRILACPVLGYYIVQENFVVATSLLAYAGLTDLVCVFRLPFYVCSTCSEPLPVTLST